MKKTMILIVLFMTYNTTIAQQARTTKGYYGDDTTVSYVVDEIYSSEENDYVFHGKYVGYYVNGSKKDEGYYENHHKKGIWKQYHDNGKLESEGELYGWWISDKKRGAWKFYTESGQLHAIKTFKEGKLEGPFKQYHAEGNVAQEGNVVNELRDGEWKDYFENGDIYRITQFNNGKTDGLSKVYHMNGNLNIVFKWKDDKLMEVLEYNDKNGNPLDPGTVKNGNGRLNSYNDEGELTNTLTVKDGVVTQQ